MKLKVITPPAVEPLTLSEAQLHLKTDEDITSLIAQAREFCESYQNRKYITQTLEAYLDDFPAGSIEFRDCSPVQSVESAKYVDSSNTEHVFDSANYSLDDVSFIHKIDLGYNKTWPSNTLKPTNGVIIRFVAGFGGAADVPESVKWAMILQMRLLYDDYKPDEREKLESARDALLSMNRVIPI